MTETMQSLFNIYGDRAPANVVNVKYLRNVAENAWYRDAVYWAVRSGIAPYGESPDASGGWVSPEWSPRVLQ